MRLAKWQIQPDWLPFFRLVRQERWILRNAIIWHKPNAMPESVIDRLSTRYEMLFLLSKSRRYWFDLDPIRESAQQTQRLEYADLAKREALKNAPAGARLAVSDWSKAGAHPNGRNPGDLWTIPTTPFPGAHFAAYPPELVRRCIVAGCKPGGTVLDPFHGSGTTGMVAQKHGRRYVGIELNQEYLDLSLETRLRDGALPFESDAS